MAGRHYPVAFIRGAVEQAFGPGRKESVRAVGDRLGVRMSTLYRWKLQAEAGELPGAEEEEPSRTGYAPATERSRASHQAQAELVAAQIENERLRAEVTALRKTIVLLGGGRG